MNMLPINAKWKRRIKWSEKQRKEQKPVGKAKGQAKKRHMKK